MSKKQISRHILFVDDERDITVLMKRGLAMHGYRADTFNNPVEALSNFKPNYYDAIILDIRMPQMSGFELAKQLWLKDPQARICFLSAFEIYAEEARKVFTSFKEHCFIRKPIIPADLIKHIEAHLVSAK